MGAGPAPDGGPSPCTPGDLVCESQVRVYHAVARSLDFSRLLQLQRQLAAAFHSAYSAVSAPPCSLLYPDAAAEVRRLSVLTRDLQRRVRFVFEKCKTLAVAIIGILPDLSMSVDDGDVGLTRGIFARLRQWVNELRGEAQVLQKSYSEIIMDTHATLERAKSAPSAAALAQARAAAHAQAAAEDRVRAEAKAKAAEAQAAAAAAAAAATRLLGGLAPAPPAAPSSTEEARRETSDREHAFLSLFLDTTNAVADTQRLRRMLTALEAGRSAGAGAGGGGGAGAGAGAAAAQKAGASAAASAAAGASASAGARRGGAAGGDGGPGDVLAKAIDDEVSVYMRSLPSSPGGGLTSPTSPTSPPFSVGAPGAAPAPDAATSTAVTAAAMPPHPLSSVLEDMRNIDEMLLQFVSYWQAYEVVLGVIVRREEHAETLLTFATSARSKSKAMENLMAYEQFWHAFAFLCHRFSSVVEDESKDLYSWLIQPMSQAKIYQGLIEGGRSVASDSNGGGVGGGGSGSGGSGGSGGSNGGGGSGMQEQQRDYEMR